MSFDHYKARLAEAAWNWLEKRRWWKRGAKQEAMREMDKDRP